MSGDAGRTEDEDAGASFADAVNTGINPATTPAAAPASGGDAARRELLARFHAERTPLAERMNQAPNEQERRRLRDELHQLDDRYLQQLAQYPAGTRYQHDDAGVRSSVVAALQLRAAYFAESRLGHSDEGRRDAEGHLGGLRASGPGVEGGAAWCGAFANAQHGRSGMDSDLGRAFMHTTNAENFFRYRHNGRNPGWIRADGTWHHVREFHQSRGSERQWWDAEAVRAHQQVTPQAGDVVLIDHSGSAAANHVAMVHSYDPSTHRLTMIDGNGGGFVVDHRRRDGDHGAAASDPNRAHAEAAAGGQSLRRGGAGDVTMSVRDLDNEPTTDQVNADVARVSGNPGARRQHSRIYGLGRMSAVDYEDHEYSVRDPGSSNAAHDAQGRARRSHR